MIISHQFTITSILYHHLYLNWNILSQLINNLNFPKKNMMLFLTVVVISRYPTTNNQLRNSSNPRQQATINNGRVTLQPIQGRQTSVAAGTSRTYTPGASGNNSGKQRTIYLLQCEGKPQVPNSTKPKRTRDDLAMPSSEQSNVVNHSETEIT
ncbi:hypothetical protein Tco_0461289 [Tanacetum coccineum]